MYSRLIAPHLARLHTKLLKHGRVLSLVSGSIIVSIWTVLRQITNGVNFDIVGQIGLAQQWSQGLHSGTQLGVTNYVLKIPFYMAVNALGFISPVNRLFILALAFNLLTFIFLFLLFEKILGLYGIRRKDWLYLGMLWLATIAGNVFWMDYANSRNLETVGGILLLYLLLRLLKRPNIVNATAAIAVGSVVFFADSLQLYTCGLGICIYVIIRGLRIRDRSSVRTTGTILGTIGLAVVGARVLRIASEYLLDVSYLQTPRQTYAHTLHTAVTITKTLITNSLSIFGADFVHRPVTVNSIRELLSALVLAGVVVYLVRRWHRLRNVELFWVITTIVATNYAVYVASGQVLEWATARYLIMVPLLIVLLVGMAGEHAPRAHTARTIQLGWLAVSICSVALIAGAVVVSWPDRGSKNTHIYQTVDFMHNLNFSYALGSRDTGIVTTYFSEDKATVLPMLCTPEHGLIGSDLFYDRAGFEKLASFQGFVPIILSGHSITTATTECSEADISAQYGPPRGLTTMADGSIVMIYDSRTLADKLVLQ